jgi:hypothetical protein
MASWRSRGIARPLAGNATARENADKKTPPGRLQPAIPLMHNISTAGPSSLTAAFIVGVAV